MSLGARASKGERLVLERRPLDEEEPRTIGGGKREEKERSPIDVILDRLGGAGKARVYRVTHNEQQWEGSFEITRELAANLEEYIAENYGGGKYYVKLVDRKGEYEGMVPVHINPRVVPPKERQSETTPAAPVVDPNAIGNAVVASLAPVLQQLAGVMAAVQQQATRPAPAPAQTELLPLLTFMNAEQRRHEVALIGALSGRSSEEKPADPIATFSQYAKMFETLGWSRGGAAEPDSALVALGKVALPKIIETVGPKLFADPAPSSPPPSAPVQQQPAALPPAAPSTQPATARVVAAAEQRPVARPPQVAKKLGDEELARIRERRQGKAPTTTATAPTTPPPKVADVAPAATKAGDPSK